ncbi:MAG: enoyl-CoA hydratase/isomerase family protein [Novosphingobium sp.]|uniref:enoyl-CoA hydratase/isomerase family protein n=1 Tax=Thauera propionica TaxID=2019431 RepID=UPI0023F4463E|nr:enoyl-CoA hydratase/isomerase family protein [Thauera propionica]MDD3674773.1 enoyl-CoA hydratase/isomerase family protein [Thauera propionica]
MALVRFEQAGEIARITLARSQAGNAVNPALIADLGAAVDAASAARPRSVLITAEGPNFSMGGDLKHLLAAGEDVAGELERMAQGFHDAQLRLIDIGVPIVAAVRGNVIGGGFGLALTSDYLLCSDQARFSTGYSRLGLSTDAGVSFFLTRALGMRRARLLLMDARFFAADDAVALGIADRKLPDDQLDAAALALAEELAQGPTAAYAAIRRLTEAATTNSLAAQLDLEASEIVALARREDVRAALSAPLTRSKPVFTR